MTWEPQDHSWNQMFHELSAFGNMHGHCRVPRTHGDLARWVEKQRHHRRSINRLSNERVAGLDSVGFVWKRLESAVERTILMR